MRPAQLRRAVQSYATFSWHRFIAVQLWILVLFLIYVTASELNLLRGTAASSLYGAPPNCR